jgi:hypothetical protein
MRTSYVGVAVLLAGLVALSAGGAAYVDVQKCRTVAGLTVTPVEEPPADLPRVDYADLTADQRDVFDRVRGAQQALVQRGLFEEAQVVAHDGEDYVVGVSEESDCGDRGGVGVHGPLLGGALLVAGGAVGAKYGN